MPEEATTFTSPKFQDFMTWDLGRPFRYYMKDIARNPLLMALIQGAGGYMLGKYVGAPAMEWLQPSPTPGLRRRRKRILPWLGAAAGLIPPALSAYGRLATERDPTLMRALTRGFYEEPTQVKRSYVEQRVPVYPGVQNLILMDRILSPYEKAVAMQAVNRARAQSDNDRGLVTTGDLMRGAIGAGLGYLGAKLFGKVLGLGFAISPKAQKRLNQVGVIGGILGNTGILRVGT